MKKLTVIVLGLTLGLSATIASVVIKHASVEPDLVSAPAPKDAVVIGEDAYLIPQFTPQEISFLKNTWKIMNKKFLSTGALRLFEREYPNAYRYWTHDNVIRNKDNGWGYWMAICWCYESAEFADMFDEFNEQADTQWIRDFKEFGVKKGIADYEDGVWFAYEY